MKVWRSLNKSLPPDYLRVEIMEELLAKISHYLQLPIKLDVPDVQLKGILDFEVGLDGKRAWFSALRSELEDKNLNLSIAPSGLIIRPMSPTDHNSTLELPRAVFDVSSLAISSDDLQNMIFGSIYPESWEENGGDGTCEIVVADNRRYLVIFHHEDLQAEVFTFLEALAVMSVEPSIPNVSINRHSQIRGGLIRCHMQASDQALVSFFESPTPQTLRRQLYFGELINDLRTRGIPVHSALPDDTNLDQNMTMKIDLRGDFDNLYNDLSYALSQQSCRLTIGNSRVEFWDQRDDDIGLTWALYDSTCLQIPNERLVNYLTSMISPDCWEENGGIGGIVAAKLGNRQVLTVLQTPSMHWQVRRFLERLADFVTPANATVSGRSYSLSTPIAIASFRDSINGSTISTPHSRSISLRTEKNIDDVVAAWPIHGLLLEFTPGGFDLETPTLYPIFYDVTPLHADDDAIYTLVQLAEPENWETNGGEASNYVARFGMRRILTVRTNSAHHRSVVRFFERLSRNLNLPAIRSNWQPEWVPTDVAAAEAKLGPEFESVEVFALPGSGPVQFDALNEAIMESIDTESWSGNGGVYELAFARINHRNLLAVWQCNENQQKIGRLLQRAK
ncbi:MAG: hypothetical protein JNL67_07055 [Planctomycetaceae bacterium]|nr:hypothetical protein [Planctomycetaceae bacterium]